MIQDEHAHWTKIELELHRMKIMMEEIAERQSLARFDNTMFLSYPLLIALLTVLGNMIWNYEALQRLQIFGQPMREVLLLSIGFLAVVGIPSFLGFILACMKDDMRGRMRAYWRFLIVCGLLPMIPALLPAGFSLSAGLGELNLTPLWFSLLIVPVDLAAFSLWIVVVSRMCLRLLSWFENNMPTRFVSVRDSERVYRNMNYTFLIGGKIGFTVCWVIWIPITAMLLMRYGFSQSAFYNLLTLVCLIAVGIAVWLEKE